MAAGDGVLDSATKEECLSEDLSSGDLLLRLFHEEGVRVFEPIPVQKKCRCGMDRVENVLLTMAPEERDYMVKDGKITMRCEFCSRDYDFDPAYIQKQYSELDNHDETNSSS